jgi:uncharacterized protein (TIGR03083 family)
MQLTPRYEAPPVIAFAPPVEDVAAPLLRQRRRLASTLADLTADQWAAPSRCDGWTVQDVVSHLVSTNQFWAYSVACGVAGEPTRLLATFDPVATPAAMAAAERDTLPADILERYTRTVEELAAVVDTLDDAQWSVLAEAPPGHVAIDAVLLHALWDAWIHERDIVLPLGLAPVDEPDEVRQCLRYVAALAPGLAAAGGSTREGLLGVQASDPGVEFVVAVAASVVVRDAPVPDGAPCLAGRAVELVEGLSFRGPLDHALGEDERWLFGGLDEVFDRPTV